MNPFLGLKQRMLGGGYDPNQNTGDEFQNASMADTMAQGAGMGPGYLAGAELGAGLGGLLAGQKHAIPGMLGGAAAGAVLQHGGLDWLKGLFNG